MGMLLGSARGRWGQPGLHSVFQASHLFRPCLTSTQDGNAFRGRISQEATRISHSDEGTDPCDWWLFTRQMPSTTLRASSRDTLGCHKTLEAEGNHQM